MTQLSPTTLTPATVLEDPTLLAVGDLGGLRGFGGLHGGLALALLTRAAGAELGGELGLRFSTAHFLRPLRAGFEVEVGPTRRSRALAHAEVRAFDGRGDLVRASCVFGPPARRTPTARPPMPEVEPPDRLQEFRIPAEFVPFTQHLEIRPADDHRPFAGGRVPTLTAWIRLVEDDLAPDPLRLIVLLDALAPSAAAVLDELVDIPTIELSVRLAENAPAGSPWVLVRATSHRIDEGWVDERLDAWSATGHHLATATQIRLVRP